MINLNAIEKALLVGIVKEKNWNILILNNITEEFFSYQNKPLYKYIKDYVDENKYPDLPLVQYEFQIDDDELSEYLEIGDLENLCKTIKTEYFKGRIIFELQNLNELIEKGEVDRDPINFIDAVGQAQQRLRLLGYQNKSSDILSDIDEVFKIDPNDVITTGFPELDEKLTGWKRGEELIVLVGRTGQGKSWLGLKFAVAAALCGERVGIYSGEMSKPQLQERILCCGKQSYTSTRDESLQYLKDNNINIKVLTFRDLRRKANVNDIEEFIIRENLSMIIIDQLSLMEDVDFRPGSPLRQQYGNISMDLFSLTVKHRLPCVLLVQSNRQGGQEVNGPTLENIAESDAVAQNATRVITMRNENGVLTMNIVKNRYGESGLTQKYEVDYGINKYKPIKELQQTILDKRSKTRTRQVFGGNSF